MSEPEALSPEQKEQAREMAAVAVTAMLAATVPFLIDVLIDFAGRLLDRPGLIETPGAVASGRGAGTLLGVLALLRLLAFARRQRQPFLTAIGGLVVAGFVGALTWMTHGLGFLPIAVAAGMIAVAALLVALWFGAIWLFGAAGTSS